MSHAADFRILDRGSVWSFEPVSVTARTCVAQELHVEPWQWLGPPTQLTPDIERAILDGLTSQQALARELGVSQSLISRLKRRAASEVEP